MAPTGRTFVRSGAQPKPYDTLLPSSCFRSFTPGRPALLFPLPCRSWYRSARIRSHARSTLARMAGSSRCSGGSIASSLRTPSLTAITLSVRRTPLARVLADTRQSVHRTPCKPGVHVLKQQPLSLIQAIDARDALCRFDGTLVRDRLAMHLL